MSSGRCLAEAPPEAARVVDMRLTDLLQVAGIERQSFADPWDLQAFLAEFLSRSSMRLVIRAGQPQPRVVAYGIFTLVADELHVSNLAVHPGWRRSGLADALLAAAFARAAAAGAERVFLEVRPSNHPALTLYRKLGFEQVGLRRGYYAEDGEDALVLARGLRSGTESPLSREDDCR